VTSVGRQYPTPNSTAARLSFVPPADRPTPWTTTWRSSSSSPRQ